MITGLEKTSALKTSALTSGSEVLQGRFKVLELLGRGGMGDVYLAEQLSLGRKVALKTLREDLSAQPGMTERFRREALLLSSVDHPSVVRVIDFGEAERSYVLVMEYVEGDNLSAVLREGPFTIERTKSVLRDIAEGLDAIHSRGIVHRDLKLDNVLLAKSGSVERARLLDFGIARLAEGEGPTGAMTQAGLVLGTPEYPAPEQATGGKIDARADVYAFGILGYKLLTGRNPFDGPSPREFLLQHISAEPPPPERFAPQVTAAPELTALIMQCLKKSPAERPESGAALFKALSGMVGTPTSTSAVNATVSQRTPAPMVEAPLAHVTRRLNAMPTRSKQVLAAVVGVAFLAVLVLAVRRPRAPVDETPGKVAALLDAGKPVAAITMLDASPKSSEAPLRLLRAEALHQQQRHEDEWQVVAQTKREDLGTMRLQLLSFLLDDYAKREDGEAIRSVLAMLPESQLSTVESWAEGPFSLAQWGAVRWADVRRLPDVDYVKGYLNALASTDCDVLAKASQRLGELGDQRAVDGLRRVVASPRKAGFFIFGSSCGHNEASEALRKLKAPETEPQR